MDELFDILDITGHEDWPPALTRYYGPSVGQAPLKEGPSFIPEGKRSSVLQVSREAAEREAVRLAARAPGRTFALFEATHLAARVPEVTHVNFKGEPIQHRTVARLMPVDDGIPF